MTIYPKACVAIILWQLLIPLANAERYQLDIGQQSVMLDVHYTFGEDQQTNITSWISEVCSTLSGVLARMPRDSLKVVIKPIGKPSTDPVPWAQVNRGNPDSISFYIDETASRKKLLANWTAYHEFSHLLIPYRGYGDLWFSEGLASYYQNILQLRAGLFDEARFWQKLDAGFKRGQADQAHSDLSLAELSPRMRETRSFMRSYWSGAMLYLLADIELRRQNGSINSLDKALGGLNQCCRDQAMSAREIIASLDKITGGDQFSSLFSKLGNSYAVPDHRPLFEQLGISITDSGVSLSDDAPLADIRKKMAHVSQIPSHRP